VKKSLFMILIAASISGCATDLVEVREGWYGATYEDVTRAWGKPSGSTTLADGGVEHVWLAETPSYSGSSVGVGFGIFRGSGNIGVGAGTGVSVPVGGPAPPHRCERRLTFRDNMVVDQVWNGEPRYCSGFRRPG
jgi:hypothetical protein